MLFQFYISPFLPTTEISNDEKCPTVFSGTKESLIPKGLPLYDFATAKRIVYPNDILIKTKTIARGFLNGNKFSGKFEGYFNMNFSLETLDMNIKGDFEMMII